jgi:hypothetical protein
MFHLYSLTYWLLAQLGAWSSSTLGYVHKGRAILIASVIQIDEQIRHGHEA